MKRCFVTVVMVGSMLALAGCSEHTGEVMHHATLCGKRVEIGANDYTIQTLWDVPPGQDRPPISRYALVTGSCSHGASVSLSGRHAEMEVVTRDAQGLPTSVHVTSASPDSTLRMVKPDGQKKEFPLQAPSTSR